ncbi:MAG: hypothetical protein FD161_4754 [Limisphaerales bacterium]|nr:MAG: hypothetical protein FD161_4754 [Limisphaerales bacterium]TXT44841.1 MAG: hypothetical protein FD140_4807 [Limisphaerales bacterium]
MRNVLRAACCVLRVLARTGPASLTQHATRSTLFVLLLVTLTASASTPQAILFRNGDLLTGQLESITPTNGLRWRHADAAAAIELQPSALAEVHLGAQSPPPATALNFCFVRLTNGDELSGNLKSLDEQQVVLETWFAGTLTLPRSRVASLRPAGPSPRAIFAGPDGLDGWTMGKALPGNINPGQWHFANGAFVATQPSSIARDVKLPPSSTLEFDLAWQGTFALAIALYTDSLQPVRLAQTADEPPFGGFYSLQLNSYSSQLLLVRHKDSVRQLGMAVIPLLQQTNRARVAIKTSREQKTITLLLNGVVAKQWADTEGFGGEGTGIRLVHQGQGPMRVANLRVTEWDGRLEENVAPLVPNVKTDVGRLVNRDSVAGRLVELKEGRLRFAVADNFIEIPLDRVAQVDFATERAQTVPLQAGDIRVFFAGRGSLTFALESWTEQGVRASSGNFGKAQFAPRAFSRIVFQPQP